MTVSRFGIATSPPPGWHVEIRRDARESGIMHLADGGTVEVDDVSHPVLHACTRTMATERGDFGTGVVSELSTDDVFLALVEYDSEVADTGLFEYQGLPRLAPSHFDPNNLQRPLPGRSAAQYFFSQGGRAFCLFVVLGAHSRRMATVPLAARMSRAISITPASIMRVQGGMP